MNFDVINGPFAFALLILGFGFLIFVHELGHFLVAKWVGIKVTQFAVGFGHAIVCWRKGIGFRIGTTEPEYQKRLEKGESPDDFGETEYRLNWMPLGGYVKMLGQDDLDPTALSEDPRSFNRKPVWARACVISAGVIMNAIFAAIFFVIAFLAGVAFPPAVVGEVEPGSPAATATAVGDSNIRGLRTGDRIVSIDGKPATDWADLRIAAALGSPDEPIALIVRRPHDGGQSSDRLEFRITPEKHDATGMLYIGVGAPISLEVPKLDSKAKEKWGETGVREGMRITHVNDTPVQDYGGFHNAIQSARGGDVTVTYTDQDGSVTISTPTNTDLQSKPLENQTKAPHLLGLEPPIRVTDVFKNTAADGVLKPDDLIAEFGDVKWPRMYQISGVIKKSDGRELNVAVIRDGQRVTGKITPVRGWWPWSPYKIGMGYQPAVNSNYVAGILDDSPFAALPWDNAMQILAINGRPISDYGDIRTAIEATQGAVEVTYRLPLGDGFEETRTIQIDSAAQQQIAELPWGPVDLPPRLLLKEIQKCDTVAAAIVTGVEKTHLYMVQTYLTLVRLFQRTVPASELRGPVGIVQIGTQVAQDGWTYLMFFLGLISINLAVINFLPIPIVDGGLFVLLMIEKFRGKPVPPQVANAINLVGLALILTIFVYVTFNDVTRLITSG